MKEELTLDATTGNIEEVTAFIDAYLEKIDCPMHEQMQIDVAVDELFSNIANYAYSPNVGKATVEIDAADAGVVITFIDSGIPYNPLEREDPDIKAKVEDREIGGLGIFMVKKMMDGMSYEYRDGKNILTIRKNL